MSSYSRKRFLTCGWLCNPTCGTETCVQRWLTEAPLFRHRSHILTHIDWQQQSGAMHQQVNLWTVHVRILATPSDECWWWRVQSPFFILLAIFCLVAKARTVLFCSLCSFYLVYFSPSACWSRQHFDEFIAQIRTSGRIFRVTII